VFHFEEEMIHSKSWLNRMLIVRYFNPSLTLFPQRSILSDDVLFLENAIADLKNGANTFDLGLGGTSFRFFCYLVSRMEGEWKVRAESRLLARPQQPLIETLKNLGVEANFEPDGLRIVSKSWSLPDSMIFDQNISTQFISGLLLSSWNLSKNLVVKVKKPILSYDYLQMTIALLRQCGMEIAIEHNEQEFTMSLSSQQIPYSRQFEVELDVSSAFSLAACAVVDGDARITNWQENSIQPDMAFLNLFRQMGIRFECKEKNIRFLKHNSWNSLNADLKNCPDLFPVLAALCALASGKSKLFGARQLRHKESDRIKKTRELLGLCGVQTQEMPDGLEIFGVGRNGISKSEDLKIFNPDHDHRMAMAAAVLLLAGAPLKITDLHVVNKSYPNFWKDIGVNFG
jgi:3-phosphoshikimate 1-carboxyvinyltransferase